MRSIRVLVPSVIPSVEAWIHVSITISIIQCQVNFNFAPIQSQINTRSEISAKIYSI